MSRLQVCIEQLRSGKWRVVDGMGVAISRPCSFVDACLIMRYVSGGAGGAR